MDTQQLQPFPEVPPDFHGYKEDPLHIGGTIDYLVNVRARVQMLMASDPRIRNESLIFLFNRGYKPARIERELRYLANPDPNSDFPRKRVYETIEWVKKEWQKRLIGRV